MVQNCRLNILFKFPLLLLLYLLKQVFRSHYPNRDLSNENSDVCMYFRLFYDALTLIFSDKLLLL